MSWHGGGELLRKGLGGAGQNFAHLEQRGALLVRSVVLFPRIVHRAIGARDGVVEKLPQELGIGRRSDHEK